MTEEMSLAVFDPIKAVSVDLEKKDAAQEFDHTTPEGEKALRSWVHRVRGHKGDIERVRVATKAVAVEFGRKVDDLARELTITPQRIIDARMKPLDEIEDAKRKAAEAIVEAERVAAEKAEAERIADLKRREAQVAEKEAKIKAAEESANVETAKAEQAEREKHIAESAAQTAREEAEETARVEREATRELIRKNAEIAQANKERDAEVERRRTADESHRKKIHAEIEKALWEFLPGIEASDTTEALIEGKIPHVTINY